MKIVKNIIKYTLGLPLLLSVSVIIIIVGSLFVVLDWLYGYNEMYKDSKEMLIDLWKPFR